MLLVANQCKESSLSIVSILNCLATWKEFRNLIGYTSSQSKPPIFCDYRLKVYQTKPSISHFRWQCMLSTSTSTGVSQSTSNARFQSDSLLRVTTQVNYHLIHTYRKNFEYNTRRRWLGSRILRFSITTQVIIEILALSLAENGVIFRYNHLRRGD